MKKFSSISKNANIKSIAIGKFDSMHLAHKAILDKLGENGIVLLIKMPPNLCGCMLPYNKRQDYSQNEIYYIDFDEISSLSGVEFLEMLKNRLSNLEHIIVGSDFRFGKNRIYGAKDIENISNFTTTIIGEMSINGVPIHSSHIRKYLLNGDIKLANKLLGRFYCIEGEVIRGQGIGNNLLFPTINIKADEYVLPQDGVYATYTKINDEIFKSISVLGHRFSTDMSFAIETHINYKNIKNPPNILEIYFVEKIRDNQKFNSFVSLKEQISNDINIARNILETQNLPK